MPRQTSARRPSAETEPAQPNSVARRDQPGGAQADRQFGPATQHAGVAARAEPGQLRVREVGEEPAQADFTLGTMPTRFARIGDPWAGMDATAPGRLDTALEWYDRDAVNGEGEMPYPPEYPKMPGEPPRVQPSRARATCRSLSSENSMATHSPPAVAR